MGYLTESKLANVVDLPVALAATDLKMGDWVIVASVKVITPMQLTYKFAQMQLLSANVAISDISAANKISGNLGLAYLVLRKDYVSGSPGAAGALDVLAISAVGIVQRTAAPVVLSVPGTYSWIVANNLKADATSAIPTTTSIDLNLSVTGQARLEIDGG